MASNVVASYHGRRKASLNKEIATSTGRRCIGFRDDLVVSDLVIDYEQLNHDLIVVSGSGSVAEKITS